MLDDKIRIQLNGLVLPHLSYGEIIWGDQPVLKSFISVSGVDSEKNSR